MQKIDNTISKKTWTLDGSFFIEIQGKKLKIIFENNKWNEDTIISDYDYSQYYFSIESLAEIFLKKDINFIKKIKNLKGKKIIVKNSENASEFKIESGYFKTYSSSFFLKLLRIV